MRKHFLTLALLFAAVCSWAQNTETENLSLINSVRASAVTSVSALKTRAGNAFDALNYSKAGISQPYTASGTDTYVIASGPASISAYEAGQWLIVTFTNDNDGAATVNINSVGAVALTDNTGTALEDDAIQSGQTKIIFCTSPTQWRILNDGSGGGGGGGGTDLHYREEAGTTYTVTDADHFTIIGLSNAAGCDVTMPNTIAAETQIGFIRLEGAGDVQFLEGGTAELKATSASRIIEVDNGIVSWTKISATDFQGSGDLGQPITVAYIDAADDLKENTANKATDFSAINDTKFPTTEAVVERLSSRATKTDDYATIQGDNQKVIVLDAAITKTVTVDQLTADSYMTFVNVNVGQWNLIAGSGVTLDGSTSYLPGGEVNSLTLWWLSATDVKVISGFSTSLNSLSVNGALSVRAGLSAGVIAKIGGVINSSTTTTGNAGAGEDDLFLYEVPSNTLNDDKSSIVAVASGTFAANANNKRIRARFGGTSIFDTGAVALNSGDWCLEIQVFRTGSATQKTVCTLRTSNSTLYTTVDYATAAVDLTTPLELKVTAEATSNNDVVGELFKVRYQPAE